jgi:hypothetical protein
MKTQLKKNAANILDNAKQDYQNEIISSFAAVELKSASADYQREINDAWEKMQSQKIAAIVSGAPIATGRKDREFNKIMADNNFAYDTAGIASYFRLRDSKGQKNYFPSNSFADYLDGKIDLVMYLKLTDGYGAVVKLSRGNVKFTSWYRSNQPALCYWLSLNNIAD